MPIKVEPTKDSVVCPECTSLCYWSVHPPRQLRCCKCGHIVEGWPVEEKETPKSGGKRKVIENMNG